MVPISETPNNDLVKPVVACEDVLVQMKRQMLSLSTSDYSTILIDKKADVQRVSPIREHSLINRTLEKLHQDGMQCKPINIKADANRTIPFSDNGDRGTKTTACNSKLGQSDSVHKPSAKDIQTVGSGYNSKRNGYQNERPDILSNLRVPNLVDNVAFDNQLTNGDHFDDKISDVSVNTVELDTYDYYTVSLNCSEKSTKDTSATRILVDGSTGSCCVCIKPKEPTSLNLFGWFETKKDTDAKARVSGAKRRPSPAVFQRLSQEGKDRGCTFKHYRDTTDYMRYYRDEFTVGFTGDLTRTPPIMGRDVPDPYAMKPSNVCLVTEVASVRSKSIGLAGGKKIQDQDQVIKRGYPNLSPVRPSNTQHIGEEDDSVATPNVINGVSVNVMANSSLPQIPQRPDSSPAIQLRNKTPHTAYRKPPNSAKFNVQIVGIQHKLPITTTCNMPALCKPSVGNDVYGELRSGSNSFRKPNNNSLSSQKKDNRSNSVHPVNLNDPTCVEKTSHHSHVGCRGCTRITSLLHKNRKITKKPSRPRSQSYSQCKPLEDNNIHYRLQKMSIR